MTPHPDADRTAACVQCPDRPWADRQWGLCIFDDVVEHCSPSSFKYASYFLGQMLQSLGDLRPEVRQAAAYGVGVMAQCGGDNYSQYCTGGTPSRFVYPSIYLHLLSLSVSICLSIYTSRSIYLYLYRYLSISIYFYLSLALSVYLYLSLYISIYC